MSNSTRIGIIVLMITVAVIAWVATGTQVPASSPPQGPRLIATVSYTCHAGKTITAAYYEGETQPPKRADEPPIPGGSIRLTLSDGRMMTLVQTISADGVRYSDGDPLVVGDETFVFWSKGNGALVLENNQEKSYIGCIEAGSEPTRADTQSL